MLQLDQLFLCATYGFLQLLIDHFEDINNPTMWVGFTNGNYFIWS